MNNAPLDLELLYGGPLPPVQPCPCCGGPIRFTEIEGLVVFRCHIDSPCTQSRLITFCPPEFFPEALDCWNHRRSSRFCGSTRWPKR